MPEISDEIIAAIRERVPAYRRPLRGRFGTGLRLGVAEALDQFVELIADPGLDRSGRDEVYRGLGRGEFREQRSLDALLAAYRLGARVAWRRVAALAIEAGTDRRTLALLAEAVFAYIDSLSALSVEGYAQEQSAAAGEAERRRRRVATLLLADDPDEDAVRAAAREAAWEVPRTIAAISWSGASRRLRRRLPAGSLVVATGEDGTGRAGSGRGDGGRGRAGDLSGRAGGSGLGGLALVRDPDAPGVRDRLERAVGEGLAVLGQAVAPLVAATSARRAAAVRELAEAGVIEASGLVLADDHLAALVAHEDPGLLGALAERRLRPLERETPASRDRLADTLRAWLDHHGEVAKVASELHVHPQTVRYRLGRLRERFGEALDDPAARFELSLALRARQTENRPAG